MEIGEQESQQTNKDNNKASLLQIYQKIPSTMNEIGDGRVAEGESKVERLKAKKTKAWEKCFFINTCYCRR